FLVALCALLSACNSSPQEPGLLHSIQQAPISKEVPVTLSFRANGAGPVLVQVIGHEVELDSLISDTQGHELNRARLPYIRLGPVYQLLGADKINGEVTVKISAIHQTKNANVSVHIFQFQNNGRADLLMEQAYRHYSNAIQSTHSEAVDLWRERVGELQNAAKKFRRVGMTEQALWSEWLLAYFTYFPVGELQQAIELAKKVRTQAEEAGLPQLVLMAMQLQGQAMMERDAADTTEEAAAKLEGAQILFDQTAGLAEQQGELFEQAWTINNRANTYHYQDLLPESLGQYERVLPIALDLQDVFLANLVRGNIAMVYERQGNYKDALEALLAIRQQVIRSDLPIEQILNLAGIGRLYGKLFLFPEAVTALNDALKLARDFDSKESSGRIGLSLAMAYNDMGQQQRALDMLLMAIDDMNEAQYSRGLQGAYRLLADIYRSNKLLEQAESYRQKQQQYLTSDYERAGLLFSQGQDALAKGQQTLAAETFAQSHVAAVESGDSEIEIRSLLQYCALLPQSTQADVSCDSEHLEDRLNDWLPQSSPRFALDARFLWAQFLSKTGRDEQALRVLEDLVAEIQIYRSRLPGVLGAWYWESRENIFSTYMDLLLQQTSLQRHHEKTLIALDHLRNLENAGRDAENTSNPDRADLNTDEIRNLLARLTNARDAVTRQEIGRAIDQKLMAAGSGADYALADEKDLMNALASLPVDATYLTYYFSRTDAWAWIGGHQGVQLIHLGESKPILDLLKKVGEGLQIVGNQTLVQDLDTLGSLLLQPVEAYLPVTIYLGSTGELAGFPFEILRLKNRHLAQDHMVINTLSLEGLDRVVQSGWKLEQGGAIFLAGSPEWANADMIELKGAASEIENIASLFRTRKVHTFSGTDLHLSSFAGPEFRNADLIHIASHASINFDYPELSRMMLSGRSNGDGADYLTPLDIGQRATQASLVVLSACETTGVNTFSFDSNLGFVTEFLQSGAETVVASLWPVSDLHTRDFMRDFYSALLRGEDIPVALIMAKRKQLQASQAELLQSSDIQNWAAFQLFVE
ncbi:MAG: CHAT domain-containing protein, partial [Lysobacterales bacterium]